MGMRRVEGVSRVGGKLQRSLSLLRRLLQWQSHGELRRWLLLLLLLLDHLLLCEYS